MTDHKPTHAIWSWLRIVWSWLLLAVEAAVIVVWVVTVASALSGDWPHQARWIMLLSVTAMAVSRRLQSRYPFISSSLFVVASVVMVAAMFASRS